MDNYIQWFEVMTENRWLESFHLDDFWASPIYNKASLLVLFESPKLGLKCTVLAQSNQWKY